MVSLDVRIGQPWKTVYIAPKSVADFQNENYDKNKLKVQIFLLVCIMQSLAQGVTWV